MTMDGELAESIPDLLPLRVPGTADSNCISYEVGGLVSAFNYFSHFLEMDIYSIFYFMFCNHRTTPERTDDMPGDILRPKHFAFFLFQSL